MIPVESNSKSIEAITAGLSAVSLSPTEKLLQKSPGEKRILAQQLAEQLRDLHKNGLVHRYIHLEMVQCSNGIYSFKTDEVIEEKSVRGEEGVIGYSGETLAPERFYPPFVGDWYKGDIYALGVLFCQLAGITPDRDKQEEINQFAIMAKHQFTHDPLPQNEFLEKLGAWMMHSNPDERPESMEQVCHLLQKHVGRELPELALLGKEVLERPLDEKISAVIQETLKADKDLKRFAAIVTKIISTAKTGFFTPEKSLIKIFYLHEQNCVLFLPKAKQKGGTFKNSRKTKALFLFEKKPQLVDCHALTSLKQKGEWKEGFYNSYQREMTIYPLLENAEIFPAHLGSYCFNNKLCKRIGLYEHVPMTFNAWIKHHKKNPAVITQTVRSMLETVSYLHKKGLVHRDLKPSNMLVRDNGKVLLCDVDSVCVDKAAECINELVGTVWYRSPERDDLDYQGSWIPTDAYSVGCVIYEIAFGKAPPWFIEDEEQCRKLKIAPLTIDATHGLQVLALRMVEHEVKLRLTVEAALDLPQQLVTAAKEQCVIL